MRKNSKTTVRVRMRMCKGGSPRAVIYYLLTCQRRVKWISSGMTVLVECGEARRPQVDIPHAESPEVGARVARDVARLERILQGLERAGQGVSLDEAVRLFREGAGSKTLAECFSEEIGKLKENNRLGTARNYRKTCSSLLSYLAGRDLPVEGLTRQVLSGYEAFLKCRGVCRNTQSFYMRILRALYNKYVPHAAACDAGLFGQVYTGVDRTRKRAVPREVVSRLRDLDLSGQPSLALCRDLFLFSLYARGMAFVDIVYMKKSDIMGGVISYVRRKTGQRLSVRLEGEMHSIIQRHSVRDSPYVFPILRDGDAARTYARYESALNCHNRHLAQLSLMLGGGVHLTSYAARHTWATVARDCHIPISVISAGMGHTSQRTTEIYLKMLDDSVVDEANRLLINSLENRGRSLCKRPYRHETVW